MARVVEFFQRMARARHGLDPEIGWPADAADLVGAAKLQSVQRLVGRHTHTTAGGLADFRSPHGERLTGTAFDEYSITADVRVGIRGFLRPNIRCPVGPIPRRLLLVALSALYVTMVPGNPPELDTRSFGVFRQNGQFVDLIPVEHFITDPGADPSEADKKIYVDPEEGLLFLPPNPDPPIPGTGPYVVSYHYGLGAALF